MCESNLNTFYNNLLEMASTSAGSLEHPSASPHLQKVLEEVVVAARTQKTFFKTWNQAVSNSIKQKLFFSLFERELIAESALRNQIPSSEGLVQFRNCDVTVGFLADTDATFTLCAGCVQNPIRIPVSLKAGEFQLAWRGEAAIPIIRFAFHHVWVEQLEGSVRCIHACLEPDERRELAQLASLPLGSEYITASGMIGKKE